MSRTVIDLDARATILDASERLAAAPPGTPVVFVVPAGAPFARNPVFLEVARSLAGDRRLSVVSSDARARSIATSVHVPAYASLGSKLGRKPGTTEVTDLFLAGAAGLLLLAGVLSALWSPRLP